MRTVFAFALCVLAGCAQTPAQVLEAGPRTVHDTQLDSSRAAGCISRNAENMVDSIQAPVRPLPQPNHFEVIVRNMNASGSVLLIAQTEPRHQGAQVTMIGPGYGLSPPRPLFVQSLLKGC